jgi:5'-nucleotidase
MKIPLLLLTNDDGIQAPGLAILASALAEVGDVWVYAPDREQSAVGHGVSLHRPLRVKEVKKQWFMVDGTPTDCVMLAVRDLLKRRPDLVFSGINPGANMGDDVTYSGTVAGAYEGMLLRIPSLAVSVVSYQPRHVDSAAKVARLMAEFVLEHPMPPNTMYNINVPDAPYEELKGLSWTRMGQRDYQDEIIQRRDPRGLLYYWIGGAEPSHVPEQGTDFEAVDQNRVSVTPLHRDLTNYLELERLGQHGIDL